LWASVPATDSAGRGGTTLLAKVGSGVGLEERLPKAPPRPDHSDPTRPATLFLDDKGGEGDAASPSTAPFTPFDDGVASED
jgi:hypothetical protein